MRYLHDIPHKAVKISLYSWNSKYIVKIEAGPYEQIYKVAEFDVTGPEDLATRLNDKFIDTVLARFSQMDADWTVTLEAE